MSVKVLEKCCTIFVSKNDNVREKVRESKIGYERKVCCFNSLYVVTEGIELRLVLFQGGEVVE